MYNNVTIGNITLKQLERGYNSAGQNERSIEVALAAAFIEAHKNVVEVGAVTPYYSEFTYDSGEEIRKLGNGYPIVDQADPKGTVLMDVLKWNGLKGKSILSISTLEHMGTGKYGLEVDKYKPKYFLQKVLDEAKDYLLTIPIGYNDYADHLIKTWDGLGKIPVIYLARDEGNQWYITDDTAWAFEYDKPYKWANAIAVITNWEELLIEPEESTAPNFAGTILEITTSENEEAPDYSVELFELKTMTIAEIVGQVTSGRFSVEDALFAEKAGKNRKSLITKLEGMLIEVPETDMPILEGDLNYIDVPEDTELL